MSDIIYGLIGMVLAFFVLAGEPSLLDTLVQQRDTYIQENYISGQE